MANLVIGGVEVKATEFRELPEERGGGGLRRTVNGQLRGRSDWVKRAFSCSLIADDSADLADIRAQADPDVDETVSGDLIGASLTCRVQMGEIEYIRDRNTWWYSMPATIREV